MKIVDRKIVELNAADYNPRKLSTKEHSDLTNSLQKFGIIDPIIINSHPKRKNVIIGGHQRVMIWNELGNETIPCVELNLGLEDEKELNVRLNKNTGSWDWQALVEFYSKKELEAYGFNEQELKLYEQMNKAPQIPNPEAPNSEFDQKIKLKVTEETYNLWQKWCARVMEETGYDNPSKAFEFAIIEAMNTPVEKWKVKTE